MPTVQAEGQFLLVFGTRLEDELEGTDPFAQWGVMQSTPRPTTTLKWSTGKGLSAPNSTTYSQAQAATAGCEEQLMICIEANDSPWGATEQAEKMSSSKSSDSIYSRVQKSPRMK